MSYTSNIHEQLIRVNELQEKESRSKSASAIVSAKARSEAEEPEIVLDKVDEDQVLSQRSSQKKRDVKLA